MLLYTFLDAYDLSGKQIAPFCTSGGSGLCGTVAAIRRLEPHAAVLSGLSLGGPISPQTIAGWLSKLGTLDA